MSTPAEQEQPAYLVYLQPGGHRAAGLGDAGGARHDTDLELVDRLVQPLRTVRPSPTAHLDAHAMVQAVLCIPLVTSDLPAVGDDLEWQALEPAIRRAGAAGRPLQLLVCAGRPVPPLPTGPNDAPSEPHVAPQSPPVGVGHESPLLASTAAPAPPPVPPLSAREIEVLERIAMGKSNKVIARDLGLSPHTVKRHVARILHKTQLASRGQAANWYWHNGPRNTWQAS